MLVGPFPAGWGAVAVILPPAPGAGVGLGWNGHIPGSVPQPLSPALCAQRRNCKSPCGMTGLILKQRQSQSP